jgi:hypothetical protein
MLAISPDGAEGLKLTTVGKKGANWSSGGIGPREQWQLVGLRYDGQKYEFIHNGQVVGQADAPDESFTNTESLIIGADFVSGEMFHGRIDELALFRRSLTDDQLAQWYEVGRPPRH